MEKIIVLGAGGLAKRILDIVERAGDREIVGLIAPERAVGERFHGYPVLGDDDQLATVVGRSETRAKFRYAEENVMIG